MKSEESGDRILVTGERIVNPHFTYRQEDQMEEQVELGTGKKHDAGKTDIALISADAILEEARVMTFGKEKYGADNWRGGFKWMRVISAVLRHIYAWIKGETYDPETGYHHLAHARCGLAFLIEFNRTHPELDNRPGVAHVTGTKAEIGKSEAAE